MVIECLRHKFLTRGDHKVAFICADGRCKEGVKLHFNEDVSIFNELSDFYNEVAASHEKHSSLIGKLIAKKAPPTFYTPNDPHCLYKIAHLDEMYKQTGDAVDEYPAQAHRLYLMKRNLSMGNPPLLGYDAITAILYDPISEEKVWHVSTELEDFRDGRTHWKTYYGQVRRFELGTTTKDFLSDMIRVYMCEAVWSCKTDDQSNFTDLKLEGAASYGELFVEPLWDSETGKVSEAWQMAR